jgi:uncharacterized membrane protein YbaN (DUF454 family)
MMGEAGVQTRWIKRPRSLWRLVVGWSCIPLGLAGLILPLLPGIPVLIFGLVLLSTQYEWAHSAMMWMKNKFHKKQPGK